MMSEKWYKDGLRFKCTGCGGCCTGAPGYIWVTEKEIAQIALSLEMTPGAFLSKYVRTIDGRYSLLEKDAPYDCIFLKEHRCEIYKVRPRQCRTFPWWEQNLESRESWENTARSCPGINEEAPLFKADDIDNNLNN